MIGELFVLRTNLPLYHGRENLAQEEEFLLTGIIPKDIQKSKKYGFVRRASQVQIDW